MSTLSPDGLKVTKEMEDHIQTLNMEQIKQYLKDQYVAQGLAHQEWDNSIYTMNEPGTVPKGYARSVTIDGKKHTIEAATELELEKALNDLYRAQMQPTTTTTRQTEQPRVDQTRLVNQADADQKAALSLEFQMGRLSADEYLQQSGAIDSYLANQGVDIAALREVTASKQSERTIQSWAEATEEFKNSSAGSSWPGGEANRAKLGEILVEMDATDHPNAENIALAYRYMQENNLLVENQSVEQEKRIANANSPSELNEALGYNERVRSSSLFGR